jgi:hypothetical protein
LAESRLPDLWDQAKSSARNKHHIQGVIQAEAEQQLAWNKKARLLGSRRAISVNVNQGVISG